MGEREEGGGGEKRERGGERKREREGEEERGREREGREREFCAVIDLDWLARLDQTHTTHTRVCECSSHTNINTCIP